VNCYVIRQILYTENLNNRELGKVANRSRKSTKINLKTLYVPGAIQKSGTGKKAACFCVSQSRRNVNRFSNHKRYSTEQLGLSLRSSILRSFHTAPNSQLLIDRSIFNLPCRQCKLAARSGNFAALGITPGCVDSTLI